MSVSVITLFSAFAIDIGWLYFRRQHVQEAADAAALAGGWALEHGYTDSAANALAQQVLSSNGYGIGGGMTVTLTPHSNSTPQDYTASVTSPEPLFFGFTISRTGKTNVIASATATYDSSPPIGGVSPAFYGLAKGGPIVMEAYGPDQGDTRGDAVNTRWNDVTGEYAKTPNPMNYNASTALPLDTGVNYQLQPAANFASLNPVGDSKMRVQIFDPQTSVSSWDTSAVDQYVGTGGGTLSSSSTPNEKWTYTLYAENTTTGALTQISTATYGESDTNLEANWVSPPGFVVDLSSYNMANTTFIVNVKTGNPYVAGQINALDKNGYLLRAGPDFDESSSSYDKAYQGAFFTDANGDTIQYPGNSVPFNPANPSSAQNTSLPDSTWNSLAVPTVNGAKTPLVSVAAQNELPLTAYENGTGVIYFGNLPANPNTSAPSFITFNGFDEDSGASGISYTVSAPGQPYDGTTFSGELGWQAKDNSGNGIWSSAGAQNRGVSNATTPSNTVYFPPGVYKGGTWTANYQTGKEDTSTWNWSVNWAGSPGSNFGLRLISTTYSDY